MTPPSRRAPRAASVVARDRRRGAARTSRAELDALGRDALDARRSPTPAAAPDRRARSPRPGLHLIAEVKRSLAVGRARSRRPTRTSSRAPAPTRPAARPRSPSCASRTGSAARSTTCAPSAPRSSIPVLAKEFVVDAAPAAACSGPPAPTSCCCSRSSTRPTRLARLVERALRPRPRAARRGPRRARARARARHRTRG